MVREADGSLVDSRPPVAPAADEWGALLDAVVAAGPIPVDYATDEDLASAEDPGWPPRGLLDQVEPGPLLASLLAGTDLTSCSADDLVGAVRAAYRLQSWAAAVELAATTVLVERCAGWRGVAPEGAQVPGESVSAELMAAVEVGCALDLAPATARARVVLAGDLARLPVTRLALTAGVIDLPKARLVVEELRPLTDGQACEVEARIVPGAAGGTRAQLAGRLRRAVLAVDPAAAQARQERARAGRRVEVFPLSDGMAGLTYLDAADRVQALFLWLTGRAQAATGHASTDPRTLDQVRADVLADLGEHGLAAEDLPVRHGRRPQIQVAVAVTTLLGLDELPGELTGYGPIPADTARRIAAEGTWRRLLTDPRTGRFDELSVESYEAPQDLVDHVVARDRTCRSPGCRTPAARCDLDHRVPHPRGPTAPANLDARCRSHHTVKTHTDTAVVPDGAGGLRITLPSGRGYHRPAEHVLDGPQAEPWDAPPF